MLSILAAVVAGRLCIGAPTDVLSDVSCKTAEGHTIQVTASPQERVFLWTSRDESTAQVGTIAPKATTVSLESDERRELKVKVNGDISRDWPSHVRIHIRGKKPNEWTWELPPKAVPKLQRILAPTGTYAFEVTADHHRPLRDSVDLKSNREVQWRLVGLPVVRGRVVDGEGKSVATASVTFTQGAPCATVNEQGGFSCDLPDRAGETVVVAAPGFGTREVYFGRGTAEFDLGAIALSKGRSLVVKLDRDLKRIESLKLTLLYDSKDRYEHATIANKSIGPLDEQLRFNDLVPGRYIVVATGSGPLQRLDVPVEVKADEDTEVTLKIDPYRLDISVQHGDDPPTNASIELLGSGNSWRSPLTLPNGAASLEAWPHGKISAFVRFGDGPEMTELVDSPELGDDPSRWEIRVKNRQISGRIVDAVTKEPVTNPAIHLVARYAHGRMMGSMPIKGDSTFKIMAAKPGQYELTVSAPDYAGKVVTVDIAENDDSKTLDIALEKGIAVPIEITRSNGTPVAGATILEGLMDDGVNPQSMQYADGSGRFTLRGAPGEQRLLYIVPNEGSFAVARVQIPRDSDSARPVAVVIPAIAGSVRVKTIDADGKPVPRTLLLRVNGEFIPPAILRFISIDVLSTKADGEAVLTRLPAGSYEIWGAGDRRDVAALMASNGTLREPGKVGLSAGEVAVTVRVPSRPPK